MRIAHNPAVRCMLLEFDSLSASHVSFAVATVSVGAFLNGICYSVMDVQVTQAG